MSSYEMNELNEDMQVLSEINEQGKNEAEEVHDSAYYEQQMEAALKRGFTSHPERKADWSKAAEKLKNNEEQESAEQDEGGEAMGYSSKYYEGEMARALKNGNKIAYENAKRNWAKAKAKEETSKIK